MSIESFNLQDTNKPVSLELLQGAAVTLEVVLRDCRASGMPVNDAVRETLERIQIAHDQLVEQMESIVIAETVSGMHIDHGNDSDVAVLLPGVHIDFTELPKNIVSPLERTGLDENEFDLLSLGLALKGKFTFQDIYKNLPNFKEKDLADGALIEFREKGINEARNRIVAFLQSRGFDVSFIEETFKYGNAYELVFQNEQDKETATFIIEAIASQVSRPVVKPVTDVSLTPLIKKIESNSTGNKNTELPSVRRAIENIHERRDSIVAERQKVLLAAEFSVKLIQYVAEVELAASEQGKGVKANDIIQAIARKLDINTEEARTIVQNLEEKGNLHRAPSRSGQRFISATQQVGRKHAEQTQAIVVEVSEERIGQLAEHYKIPILKYLNELESFQSEFKTGIAAALGEEVDPEDINSICSVLQSYGLVESKAQKGRGTGRARKGKTWSITSAGRRQLNDIARSENLNKRVAKKVARHTK